MQAAGFISSGLKRGSGWNAESKQLLLVSLGVGLLWGPLALRSVANFSVSWAFAGIVGRAGVTLSTAVEVVLCALLLWLFARRPHERWQRGLAYAAIACTVLTVLIVVLANALALPAEALGAVSASFAVLLGCSSILPLALWGLCFVALDKRRAMQALLGASVIGVTVYLVFACVFDNDARWFLEKGCSIASLVVFLLMAPCVAGEKAPGLPHDRQKAAGYFVEQAVLGACLGCAIALSGMFRFEGQPNLVLSASALVLFLVVVVALRTRLSQNHDVVVPLIPMAACLLIIVPFMTSDLSRSAQAMPAMLYVAWMTLTFISLSEKAQAFGIAPDRLVLLTLLVARSANLVVRSLLGFEPLRNLLAVLPPSTTFALLLAVTFVSVLYVTFKLVSLNNALLRERIVSEVASAEAKNSNLASQSVADAFGLTGRESEVFALMAKGHSRKFIAEKLFISEGTVRTHIANIYKKTGCSNKEEVIALVNDRASIPSEPER